MPSSSGQDIGVQACTAQAAGVLGWAHSLTLGVKVNVASPLLCAKCCRPSS